MRQVREKIVSVTWDIAGYTNICWSGHADCCVVWAFVWLLYTRTYTFLESKAIAHHDILYEIYEIK